MTDADRDSIRAEVDADIAKLEAKMGKLYIGKTCPMKFRGTRECDGPRCQLFLLQGDEHGKISGGSCCLSLMATQFGPIAGGLFQLANQVAQNAPRVAVAPAGVIRG